MYIFIFQYTASDFAAGVFSGRIPSGTRQEDGYVIINLFNDTILEMNEVFVLILNTNHPNVTILRRCALGVIRENFRKLQTSKFLYIHIDDKIDSIADRNVVNCDRYICEI